MTSDVRRPGSRSWTSWFVLPTALILAAWGVQGARADDYYVANNGSDAADGRSPESAWQTLAQVNHFAFQPGDRVLLRRGDQWREQLLPVSGTEAGCVTYGAYGEGPKPALIGSVNKSRPEDWRHEEGNLWVTTPPVPVGDDVLPNGSLDKGAAGWGVHSEGGASIEAGRDTAQFDTAPAGYRVRCRQSGGSGSHIQLCVAPFAVEAGRLYRLQYRARATAPFTTLGPRMMRSGKPWTSYASEPRVRPIRVTESWTTFTQYYLASITATDARLTFYLGDSLPPGATLHVDSLSLVPCRGELLTRDVGNIIFDHEASCGVKVFQPEKLDAQGKYWYDEDRCLLKLYSVKNPAEYYRDIECALNRHIISESNRSYVNYENLALRYGAAHGVGGGSTHHITVSDCDISYIGGADQYGGDRTVRFGNGIEFWGAAHDNLVQRCRIWEVYDAGVTNQSKGATVEHRNITYRNNLIWNCEFSFEYWNRPETSITRNVRFENNTCLNAGGGWGHAQRPDRGGRHLCFYSSPADARDIVIRNNIFFGATNNAFFGHQYTVEDMAALVMDHNCWYQPEGEMIYMKSARYTAAQFADFQKATGQGAGSFVADPRLVDPAQGNFQLLPDSPCRNAGVDAGFTRDFEGTPIPQGSAPDIGAYEAK